MAQDVTQWLAEIKALQQKLDVVTKERDEAYVSSSRWRSLYEAEAKYRRAEAIQAQKTIAYLNTQCNLLEDANRQNTQTSAASKQRVDISAINQVADGRVSQTLQAQLANALAECDRLSKALQAEKSNHEKTRKSLTSALGDTVERLTKERASRELSSERALTSRTGPVTSE
jgi:hypothetical protein